VTYDVEQTNDCCELFHKLLTRLGGYWAKFTPLFQLVQLLKNLIALKLNEMGWQIFERILIFRGMNSHSFIQDCISLA